MRWLCRANANTQQKTALLSGGRSGMMDTATRVEDQTICEAEDSCLAAKLEKLAPLTSDQFSLLASLENDKEEVSEGTVLFQEGAAINDLFVLKKGWAIAARGEQGGRLHAPTVFYPGDVIGLADIAFNQTPNTVTAATRLTVCRFPRTRLSDVLRTSPRISGLILALGMIEQSMLNDRIIVGRRTDGYHRLVLFLLQTISRLRLMQPVIRDQFHCPLNQEQIGAATGLSAVHVSRSIKKLVELGLIERHRRFFRLVDEAAMRDLVDFENRYKGLDLGWLPD